MLIDMLHQIFRNKIYLENKIYNNNYLFYLSVNVDVCFPF